MRLYEQLFADIDALDDDQIAVLRDYHDETRSLVRYYYMDIPLDICKGIEEFENKYTDSLLGKEWHKNLFDRYKTFIEESKNKNKDEEDLKAEFKKQILEAFYEAMDYVFRDGFGTGSQTARTVLSGIAGLLFGKES
jgi:SMC interacting uncharacterized protein involved in chromosome segregation